LKVRVAKFKVCFETDCTIVVPEDVKKGQTYKLSDFNDEVIESIDEEWCWLANKAISVKVLEVKEIEE